MLCSSVLLIQCSLREMSFYMETNTANVFVSADHHLHFHNIDIFLHKATTRRSVFPSISAPPLCLFISHYSPSASLSLRVFGALHLITPALPESLLVLPSFLSTPPVFPAQFFFLPYYRFMFPVCSLNCVVKSHRVRGGVWFTQWTDWEVITSSLSETAGPCYLASL